MYMYMYIYIYVICTYVFCLYIHINCTYIYIWYDIYIYDICVHYIYECILYIYCGVVIGLARCCSIRSPQTHRKTGTTTPATKWLLLFCTFAAVAGVSNTSCTLGPYPPEILAFPVTHRLAATFLLAVDTWVAAKTQDLTGNSLLALDGRWNAGHTHWTPCCGNLRWCLKSVNPECPIDNPLNWYGGYHS